MPYKYASQLAAVSATLTRVICPCQGAGPRDCIAYRLATLPGNRGGNFFPRPLEGAPPPRRITLPVPEDAPEEVAIDIENDKCDLWGISLFEIPAAASSIFKKMRGKLPHTHIAEVRITPADGVCTPTDAHHHFNLHEFAQAQLGDNIIRLLPL